MSGITLCFQIRGGAALTGRLLEIDEYMFYINTLNSGRIGFKKSEYVPIYFKVSTEPEFHWPTLTQVNVRWRECISFIKLSNQISSVKPLLLETKELWKQFRTFDVPVEEEVKKTTQSENGSRSLTASHVIKRGHLSVYEDDLDNYSDEFNQWAHGFSTGMGVPQHYKDILVRERKPLMVIINKDGTIV